MLKMRIFLLTLLVMALLPATSVVRSQSYPDRPIRMVTGGVGTSTDLSSRLIAQAIAGPLGQPVIVDNRTSNINPIIVSKAVPDGYTILHVGSSFWVGPLIEKTAYDPIRDFSPVSSTAKSPNVLVVHMSLPVKSVGDLIALARAKPGVLNYSAGTAASSPHMAGELFNAMAKVNIVRVPLGSGSARMTALISGELQMEFAPAGVALPYIRSGKMKALAVTSAEPSPLFPDLPTIASSGVPGYEYQTMSGIFAPARTSATAITRLNAEIVRFLASPDAKERFKSLANEAFGSSPQEFASRIKAETVRMAKLIKDAGIRAE